MANPPPPDELKSNATGVAFQLGQVLARRSPIRGYARWDIEVPAEHLGAYCAQVQARWPWDTRGPDWGGAVTCFPLGAWEHGDFLVTHRARDGTPVDFGEMLEEVTSTEGIKGDVLFASPANQYTLLIRLGLTRTPPLPQTPPNATFLTFCGGRTPQRAKSLTASEPSRLPP